MAYLTRPPAIWPCVRCGGSRFGPTCVHCGFEGPVAPVAVRAAADFPPATEDFRKHATSYPKRHRTNRNPLPWLPRLPAPRPQPEPLPTFTPPPAVLVAGGITEDEANRRAAILRKHLREVHGASGPFDRDELAAKAWKHFQHEHHKGAARG